MKKKERSLDIFNLSFLDVISCAFGAVIMILIVVRKDTDHIPQPTINIKNIENIISNIENRRKNINLIQSEIANIKNKISLSLKQNSKDNEDLERIKKNIVVISEDTELISASIKNLQDVETTLLSAKTKNNNSSKRDEEVGGIPTDSDYVVFIIDTSGSMKNIWDKVVKQMENILNIHPKVKGFQVLNDNGIHLISAYKNQWIPDTASRRKNVLQIIKNWNSNSNSSPVEGLKAALKKYSQNNIKTSIYIFGDDYTGASYTEVFNTINKLNNRNRNYVRINGIGFISTGTTSRFSTLMRKVVEDNRGTFIALP